MRSRDPAGLSLDALRPWLAAHDLVDTPTSDLAAEPLTGGRSNLSYRLTGPGGFDCVLRRPPLGHVLPTAHDMGREFRVLSGLHSAGYPTPRPLLACPDPGVIGAPFFLMEFVEGRIIDSPAAARDLGLTADLACASLVDTLADLHGLDANAVGLGDLGRPLGYLTRQVDRWSRQWELTRTRSAPQVDELGDRIRTAVGRLPDHEPTRGSTTVVHGDYRFDNTLLHPIDPHVVAVLDWEMSTLGDPLMDLAILLVYWTQAADGLRSTIPIAQHITDGTGFWNRHRIVARYVERTGNDLDHLDLCVAIACFKLAVIMESIRHRALAGQQVGAGASEAVTMGRSALALAGLGHQVLDSDAITGLAR